MLTVNPTQGSTPKAKAVLTQTAPAAAQAPQSADRLQLSRPVAGKPQAQGVGSVVVQTVTTGAGVVGGGGLGAMVGWLGWFIANAGGRALSSNVIGVGLLAGAALGGAMGWLNGKAMVEGFRKLSQAS
jgi:hypothetical protein